MLATSASKASKAAETSETASTKDVAKHGKDVIHAHACTSEAALTIHPGKAELVVTLTFLRVTKHIISLRSLFELLLSLFVARIAVRVVFDGHLLVSGLYLGIGGSFADTKHFVVISLLCHNYELITMN